MPTDDLPSVGDRLRAAGADGLGADPAPEALQAVLRNFSKLVADLAEADRELARSLLVDCLKSAGVHAPARLVDAHLLPFSNGRREVARSTAGTLPLGVVDIVRDGDELAWLTVKSGDPAIVRDIKGVEAWPVAALPWKPIPDAAFVKEAAAAGAPAPFAELAAHISGRVVLPKPREPWGVLLAAWVLGSYLLPRFVYFPLILLEGPPERGKTRLGKAVLYPSFRPLYTPSPTSATLFRDRANHRVTVMVDVEDLPRTLDRSDLGDLVLNSFERDGVVRRCTRPDAPPPEQVETFAAYGATILTTNRTLRPESPLASRCLRVPLPEAGGVPVPDATTPEEVEELRARAVAWAASVFAGNVELPEVEPPFTGRMRDLTAPLLQVLGAVAPDALPDVLELLATLDRDRRTDAGTSWEARVAVALLNSRSKVEAGRLYIEDLTVTVNEGLSDGEQLTPQQVGVARRNLGLAGGRGGARGRAYVVWPGDDQALSLHDRYLAPDSLKEPSAPSGPSETRELQGLPALRSFDSTLRVVSPETPRPARDAADPDDPEGSQQGKNGSILDEADRLWEAAYELDTLIGDSSATTYVAARVRELGDAPDQATVAALADKLAERLHREEAAR